MKAVYWTYGLSWGIYLLFYLLGGRWNPSPGEATPRTALFLAAFGFLYMWIPGLVVLYFARKAGVRLPLALKPNRYWLFAWLFPVALTLLSIPLSLPFGACGASPLFTRGSPQGNSLGFPRAFSRCYPLSSSSQASWPGPR